jgi:Luciferase-like monooxygenase
MRYGISIPNFGTWADPRTMVELARDAESAGWDGFFLWDHLWAFGPGPIPVVDPWIALTAAACATSRIRLGTLVTPLPRRRPVMVARQTATLDRLSGGRLTLGVGTGAFPFEWDYVGEEPDHRTRGDMLDEHLDLLDRLWTGEPVQHEGRFYRTAGPDWSAICYPPPLQQPRIPVWVGGTWPGTRPFIRAAQWDGVVPMKWEGTWEVADTAGVAERMGKLRTNPAPFDIAVPGESDGSDPARSDLHEAHERAGATWWVEAVYPWRDDLPTGLPWPAAARHRIDAGP